jgi:hypothetical protein
MNKTIVDIVKAEYYVAKRSFVDKKQSLEFAVKHRMLLDSTLAGAKYAEEEAALHCQQAASRLEDITKFLQEAGAFWT